MSGNVTTVEGIHYRTKEPVTVHIERGRISAIQPLSTEKKAALPWIAPGLVDCRSTDTADPILIRYRLPQERYNALHAGFGRKA